MRILTLFIICLLVPGISMATVFTPAPTDKSVELLGLIFGTHIGPIYLGGPPNPALIHMFQLFNFVIVTIAGVIVSYIGVVSTINTAQEGKAMGKKWGSAWIPMRAILGMLMVIPTPTTGYSIIQSSVMWLILQGVGAADQIWNGVLFDLGSGSSVSRGVHIPADDAKLNLLRDQGLMLSEDILRSAVCMVTVNRLSNGSIKPANGFVAPWDSLIKKHGKEATWYNVTSSQYNITPEQAVLTGTAYVGIKGDPRYNELCGKYAITASVDRYEWDDPSQVTIDELDLKVHDIFETKQIALQLMFNSMTPLATAIVADLVQPRNIHTHRLMKEESGFIQPEGYMDMATNAYSLTMSTLIKPRLADDTLLEAIRNGKNDGWISAGSFYFALNRASNTELFENVMAPPVPSMIPSCNSEELCSNQVPDDAEVLSPQLLRFLEYPAHKIFISNHLWDAHTYASHDTTMRNTELRTTVTPEYDENTGQIRILQKKATLLLEKYMTTSNGDPLIAQGDFGNKIMALSEQLWMEGLKKQHVNINIAAQNNDIVPAELRELVNNLNVEGALGLSIYGTLWIVGATLSIYVPLVPYMMFIVASVGWFLLVIEAIVAAPIMALSFILPSGEELGKIMQGLMILLNILLRPTLMLFGFVLAIRLYGAVIHLVNYSIEGNFDNLGTSDSQFAWFAVIVLYGAFIVALANKSFSLIYALPDKILRWMGGGPEHTDVSQELGQAKGTMGKGADAINKISSGYGERGFARLQERAKQLGNEVTGGNANDKNKPKE